MTGSEIDEKQLWWHAYVIASQVQKVVQLTAVDLSGSCGSTYLEKTLYACGCSLYMRREWV
jgi:hypothetical protein